MFFFFFLITDLIYFIPAIVVQIFNSTVERPVPIAISAKEAKAKIETNPVTTEANISKCFGASYTLNCFCLFLQ